MGLRGKRRLRGGLIATGAVDSPQATLLPLSLLRTAGLRPGQPGAEPVADVRVRRFDIGVGLHGDHIGGERDAARALFGADPVDAAALVIAASDGLQIQWLLDPDAVDVGRSLSMLERLVPRGPAPG